MLTKRTQHDAGLVAYYDNEVHDRATRDLPAERLERRSSFVDLLRVEGRQSVLEIGAGAGREGEAFAEAGLTYTGVDMAPQAVAVCKSLGLDARVASALELPFDDGAFDAVWTMSTLLHVPASELPTALSEIVRVLRPGAPAAIGLWGAATMGEELWDDGTGFGPARFFSTQTDESLRTTLDVHGDVEQWKTWAGSELHHYQWAVLRTPAV